MRNKRFFYSLFSSLVTMALFSGCKGMSRANQYTEPSIAADSWNSQAKIQPFSDNSSEERLEAKTLYVLIDSQWIPLELAANQATKEIFDYLPMDAELKDLHNNEKYVYLPFELPTQPEKIGRIEKGDVLLFGSDCLVIFYESFSTDYRYTRLGKITNLETLAYLSKAGSVSVRFETRNKAS